MAEAPDGCHILTLGSVTITAGPEFALAISGVGITGGVTEFLEDSTGGTARVEVFGNGRLEILGHHAPGVTIGSIEGGGFVLLGGNNLTVGSNNLSTTFFGKIQESLPKRADLPRAEGGSLTKIGNGKLTLSQASTYTGGTTVGEGELLVTNRSGSATGTGPVQVNRGALAGTGIIAGAVMLGTGSSSGAIILPAKVRLTSAL